jgi:NAD(P)-dependent dehydrogenase (short-subunit alcohol dehydrogenase family)
MTTSAPRSTIVTGGASGIGRASVLRLVEAGHSVTIADVDEAGGAALAKEVACAGGRAQFVRTDVSDAGSVAAMVQAALSAYGSLGGAINCAGVGQQGKPVYELSPEEWDFCNAINLRGMFFCLKYQVAAMMQSGGGAIVAVSSAAALMGLVNSVEYCASKAGVAGLVRAAAIDCAKLGIRVNALLPGGTATPLAVRSMQMNPKLAESLSIPMNRLAEPAEIAAAAVWLISDHASYVTGTSLSVDGALTIA